jgi:hypothetical protein
MIVKRDSKVFSNAYPGQATRLPAMTSQSSAKKEQSR